MSNQQVMPPEKNVDVRIPSKEYVEHPFSLGRCLSYPIVLALFLLVIGGTIWNVTPIKKWVFPVSPTPHKTSTVAPTPTVVIPSPPTDCLDQPTLPANQKPALFFCSPKYKGAVAGPFGAHIVLFGAYFPSIPAKWALHVNPFPNDTIPADCGKTMQKDCLLLPKPDAQTQISSNIFSVAWTWQKPFPEIPQNYYISAQSNGSLVTTAKEEDFTLLNSASPCISIYAISRDEASSPSCSSTPTTFPLSQNTSINIRGYNWILGLDFKPKVPQNMSVHVVATCSTPTICQQLRIFDITINGDALAPNGTFSQNIPLAARAMQKKGSYRVIAWNEIPDGITPDGFKTVANNALIFGGSKSDLLVLKIV